MVSCPASRTHSSAAIHETQAQVSSWYLGRAVLSAREPELFLPKAELDVSGETNEDGDEDMWNMAAALDDRQWGFQMLITGYIRLPFPPLLHQLPPLLLLLLMRR